MGMLMVTYPISRFVIEYLRNDEGAFFAGLTISQNISVLLLLGAAVYWAWLRTLPRRRQSDATNPSRDTASAAARPLARHGQAASQPVES
jgi:phosphatidylglycerol:prolipoprotein diacylglycerol transferase